METDILICGAGPAGSTLARALAAAGRSVLLLERERLPRVKPCGGGIPPRTAPLLPFAPAEIGAGRVEEVALDGGWTGRQLYRPSSPSFVVDRARFDERLAREAVRAGAELREGCPLQSLRREDGGFLAGTAAGPVRARVVCACDGVFSPASRALGLPVPGLGFCLEAVVPAAGPVPPRAVFRLTAVRRGYAWAFPRGEAWAIGIGGAFRRDPALGEKLADFVARTPELRGCSLSALRGAMIPEFDPGLRRAEEGFYRVGDAAGLVDPLSGEGIFYAIASAGLAAGAILGGGEAKYESALRDRLLPELLAARRRALRFRALPPWLTGATMSLPAFRRRASRLVDLLVGRSS